jgi:hypothetical protein
MCRSEFLPKKKKERKKEKKEGKERKKETLTGNGPV